MDFFLGSGTTAAVAHKMGRRYIGIEQIWKELRARGFHNEVFRTLEDVVDRLCDTICDLTMDTIRSITGRDWIVGCFN